MKRKEIATLAGGCFWCTEAIFSNIRGVEKVIPGYAGGEVENPSYKQVCTGTTGHAESIQITFDPQKISFTDLLSIFWRIHDPTTKDKQGGDIGPQYRSVIFYHNQEQKQKALTSRQAAQKLYPDPIVTEIVPFANFYPAEEYHRQYYFKNRRQPYCQLVIDPKLQKLRQEFKGYLR